MLEADRQQVFRTDWEKDLHKFKLYDLRILLDVNSGSVHIIDQVTWDVLDSLERNGGNIPAALAKLKGRYCPEKLLEVVEELEALAQQELLFTNGDWVERQARNQREVGIKSLCLHVAHDCNMSCGYCFAGEGNFGRERELMPPEVGERAVDFLLDNSGDRKNLEIDFFGGEPLLNFEVVKHLVRYGHEKAVLRGKVIKFTLTTNCLLLNDEVADFLNKNHMQVILSLDGRREINDRVRVLKSGGGSYDVIVPKILKFVESRNHENYYVRGTYTRKNMDFSEDVFHLFDLGLYRVSVEPVVAPPEVYGFSKEDIPVLEREYERLAAGLVERQRSGFPVDFYHFNIDLSGGPCLPRRVRGCGAGFEYFAVAPDGNIYPCHQFVGIEKFCMGSVFKGILNFELVEKFRSAHIYNKPRCRRCWARFFCSGGCHANAYAYSGDLLEPYEVACYLQKKRIECGIYFQLQKDYKREISNGPSAFC